MSILKLEEITDRSYNIQACSALTKEGNVRDLLTMFVGLSDGMSWLITEISSKKK